MQLREGSFSGSRPGCPRDPRHRVHRHGRYERYADCDSDQRVSVARFLCVFCGWTLSVLPAERLPYIAPSVAKVQADFDAHTSGTDPPPQTEKERGCLRRAFDRFASRVAPLCAVLGQMICTIKPSACELWKELRLNSNLEGILLLLGTKFKTSLLADYRCLRAPR
jgi:hypothetical protein